MNQSDISKRELFRLRATLRKMPSLMLNRLAEKYEVEIPFDAVDIYTKVNSFIDGLSLESRKEILSKYGDSGKFSSFIYISKNKNPQTEDVLHKAKTLLDIKKDSQTWESYPYFDSVDIDHLTHTLRIRFHYLLGSVSLIDESTGVLREHRRYWRGVVVYKPESTIMEIRVKHRTMAKRVSAMVPAYIGLYPFFSLNLLDLKMNRKFIEWISSLNSATIELPLSDEMAGSLIITARKGMDLRTAQRYNEELRYGRLRHGHVTIKREEDHTINFHIWFRDCHIRYTLFAVEDDIEYVLNALEKISEGYEFAGPRKILTEYFDKET